MYLQFFHSKHDQESHFLSGHSLLQLLLQAHIEILVDMFCQIPTNDNAVFLNQRLLKRILHTNRVMYMTIRRCQLKEPFVWRKMTDFLWFSRECKVCRWQVTNILIIQKPKYWIPIKVENENQNQNSCFNNELWITCNVWRFHCFLCYTLIIEQKIILMNYSDIITY